jgi:AcrR family transcriptional regulator
MKVAFMSEAKRESAKREAKRTEILNTALLEFCNSGIDGALMADIAKASGITRRTLYTYYPDKDSLAEDVYIENLNNLFSRMTRLLYGKGAARDAISDSLKIYLDIRRTHPEHVYYDYIYHNYCASKKKNPQATIAFSRLMQDLQSTRDSSNASVKALRVLHLYFCHLQKSVLLCVQRGELFSGKPEPEDQAYLDFLLECVRLME